MGNAASTAIIVQGKVLAQSVYAPITNRVLFSTTSATLAALAVPATTVAAGSNAGLIQNVASWSSPSAGVLDVASVAGYPVAGTATVACATNSPATITYTGTSAGMLTGCAYVSGGTGAVSTGGAVTLTGLSINTGQFFAPASGNVLVTVDAMLVPAANVLMSLALAAHGTVTPVLGSAATFELSSAADLLPVPVQFVVTGLTAGTAYTLDLLSATASSTGSIAAFSTTSTTPTGTTGSPLIMTVQAL